jgi:hypothetical protein
MSKIAEQRRGSIRRALRTLEDLIAYGNDLDDARRASLFEYGDCVAEYITRHANGDAGSATVVGTRCRGIASGSRLSGGFLYNLVRVARAFPPEQRDEYADRPWGWFLECVREREPRAAAERYAELSIGQIKDLRKTRQIPREPGYVRLQLTLRPDQVTDLLDGQRVTLTRQLPTGEEVVVTAQRRTRL